MPDPQVRAAAGHRAGDDVGLAVAVDVTGRDVDAAGEARGVSVVTGEHLAGERVERLDVRPAAGAGAGDDIGLAATGEVPGRDADAAGEIGGVGEEAGDELAVGPVEDLDVRAAAGT